ncbi:MAG TPA: PAS domain-containing protein [Proteobacteria bacterium]|nr:PAS domain-containing protein [Pseudomonadota bacterium]
MSGLDKNNRYRRIMDAISDGIYLIDASFTVTAINQAEAAYFNAHPREIVGRKCYEVFRNCHDVCPDCFVRLCLFDRQQRQRLRLEERKKGRKYVNIFYHPILDPETSRCQEVVVTIQDVSERVVLEAQASQSEKMATLGRMAAGVAHDLNNFLASIYGIIQLQQMMKKKGSQNPEKEERLSRQLMKQVEALNLLAKNLMLFSHPEHEEKFPLPFNRVIMDALSFSSYELEREQVMIECQLDETLPMIPVMKTQIQHVLLSLMMNAAEAVRVKKRDQVDNFLGKIIVRTTMLDPNHVAMEITDNGCGISEQIQDKIFEPFFSTKNDDCGSAKGTGLGLTTVKAIVDKHGGRLEWESRVNEGSTFMVVLPAGKVGI